MYDMNSLIEKNLNGGRNGDRRRIYAIQKLDNTLIMQELLRFNYKQIQNIE